MAFTDTLMQMLAQARSNQNQMFSGVRGPQVQSLPFSIGTVDEGYGKIGESLGKGVGSALEEMYVKPQAKLNEQNLLYDKSREGRSKRVKFIVQAFNQMTPETQQVYIKNPSVQRTLADLMPDAEGLFTQDQMGTIIPVTLRRTVEEQKADYREGKQGYTQEEMDQELSLGRARLNLAELQPWLAEQEGRQKQASTGLDLTRARLLEEAQPGEILKGMRESEKILADTEQAREVTKLLPREMAAKETQAKAHGTTAAASMFQAQTAEKKSRESEVKKAFGILTKERPKIISELDKSKVVKQVTGESKQTLESTHEWSLRRLQHENSLLNAMTFLGVDAENADVIPNAVDTGNTVLKESLTYLERELRNMIVSGTDNPNKINYMMQVGQNSADGYIGILSKIEKVAETDMTQVKEANKDFQKMLRLLATMRGLADGTLPAKSLRTNAIQGKDFLIGGK